jgi:hypothetical protein
MLNLNLSKAENLKPLKNKDFEAVQDTRFKMKGSCTDESKRVFAAVEAIR